jgi:hypothetical protein
MTENREDKKITIFDDGPIQRLSWGKFTIDDKDHCLTSGGRPVGAGKDIRLVEGKVSSWEERKGHRLTDRMITGIFKHRIDILIIGTGIKGDIAVPAEVIDSIHARGIGEVIVEKTPDACRIYNNLYQKGKNVAMLAHGTC